MQPLKTCIRVRFTWCGRRCAETLDLPPTVTNIRAAERMMADIRRRIDAGTFQYRAFFPKSVKVADDIGTLTAYAERWLTILQVERSTAISYKDALRGFWLPRLGGKRLADITPSDIRAAIADKGRTASGKTINNLLIPLRGLMKAALTDEVIVRDPVAPIKNLKQQSPLPDPLSVDDMERVIDHMAANAPGAVANYFEFAYCTGLRPSEMVALRWADIDWGLRTARIERALVRTRVKSTKTHQVRDVDLTQRALAVLQRQKASTFMRGMDYVVFDNPRTGRPWASEKDQRELYWQPALRALGIRKRDARQTRHTFATAALMGGVNPAYIAKQLGHKNTAMLYKHYSKWINGADKGMEAEKLESVFAPNLVTPWSREELLLDKSRG